MNRQRTELALAMGGLVPSIARELAEAMDTEHAIVVPYAATITLNAQEADIFVLGPLTGNLTLNAPTGATRGRKITLMFEHSGAARTITWNAVFRKAADGAGGAGLKGVAVFRFDGAHWVQLGGALAFI
jgi:hypothetical protein